MGSSGKHTAPEKRILYKHVNLRTALKCLTAWAPQKIAAQGKPESCKTMPYDTFQNPPPRNERRNAFGQNAKQLPLRLFAQTESKRVLKKTAKKQQPSVITGFNFPPLSFMCDSLTALTGAFKQLTPQSTLTSFSQATTLQEEKTLQTC